LNNYRLGRAGPIAKNEMAYTASIIFLAAFSLLHSTGADLYFDDVIRNHAVLQGRPLPFSLFGTSDRVIGNLAVSVSGTRIKILEVEILKSSSKTNESKEIFNWRLVVITFRCF
jgi:hypothetical protein